MHTESLKQWTHEHSFGQDIRKPGENKTLVVILITIAAMAVEIAGGLKYGSMALLAEGLHMASHTSAMAVSAFAYYYARHHARDERFSFGTGKVNSLAAFAGAVLLAAFAGIMGYESIGRLISPMPIKFNQAILVAIVGVAINTICMAILQDPDHDHSESESHAHGPHDHNLWAAYLHVLADAVTAVLAVLALLSGKYLRLNWLDPVMGLVGMVLVGRWSWSLIRGSSRVLLDMQAPEDVRKAVREAIESDNDTRVTDLHIWSMGPGVMAAEISIVSSQPRTPDHYARLIPKELHLAHKTIEINQCLSHETLSPA
jgi:cation diffusion facilitator family transporter